MITDAKDFNKQLNAVIWEAFNAIAKKMQNLKMTKFSFKNEITGNFSDETNRSVKIEGIQIVDDEIYYFGTVQYQNGNMVFDQIGNAKSCSNREAIIAHCLVELEDFHKKRLEATKLISSAKINSVLDDITGKGKAQIKLFLTNTPEKEFKISAPFMILYDFRSNHFLYSIYLDDGKIMCNLHCDVENNKQIEFDEITSPIYAISNILKDIEKSLGI